LTHLEKEPYTARARATGGRNDAPTRVSEEDAMAVDTEVSDQLETATRMSKAANPVLAILNGLLGATWRAYAQHQTHVALIEAWGLKGLASQMRVRTADEPVTINTRSRRNRRAGGGPKRRRRRKAGRRSPRRRGSRRLKRRRRRQRRPLTMPPAAISSSRFSQTRSSISAGSKPRLSYAPSWAMPFISRAAFRR